MNTERIEAAAKAGHRHVYGDGHFDYLPDHTKDRHRETIRVALAAADAVMFSDEAIERAAEALYMTSSGSSEKHWDDIGRQRQEYFRSRVRTVVAALRGEA